MKYVFHVKTSPSKEIWQGWSCSFHLQVVFWTALADSSHDVQKFPRTSRSLDFIELGTNLSITKKMIRLCSIVNPCKMWSEMWPKLASSGGNCCSITIPTKIWTECGGTSSKDLVHGLRHFSSCDFAVFRRPPSAVANGHGRGPREHLRNSLILTSSFLTSRINSIYANISLSAVTVTFVLSTW